MRLPFFGNRFDPRHTAPRPEDQDPDLLLPGGEVDIRSVNRATRRRMNFRGPAYKGEAPTLPRSVRRSYKEETFTRPTTRRHRKTRARIMRRLALRGVTKA